MQTQQATSARLNNRRETGPCTMNSSRGTAGSRPLPFSGAILMLLCMIGTGIARATPIDYHFTQTDFGGGRVSGTFTGEDLDGDGQLSSAHGEISSFTMEFTGNGQVGAFTLGFSALAGLVYDLDGFIGDGGPLAKEGLSAGSSAFKYLVGASATFQCANGIVGCVQDLSSGNDSFSSALVTVTRLKKKLPTPVPEPLGLLLLGTGLLGISWREKRAR